MPNEYVNQHKVGWRPREWGAVAGVKHTKTAELVKNKDVDSVKLGGARIITTSPREYLDRLAKQQAEKA